MLIPLSMDVSVRSCTSLFHSILNFKYIDKNISASVYGLKQTLNGITQPFSGVIIGFIITFYLLKSAFLFIFIIFFMDFIIFKRYKKCGNLIYIINFLIKQKLYG